MKAQKQVSEQQTARGGDDPTLQQLRHEIREIDRRIERIENGDLATTIEEQSAAPSCTICEQVGPGIPGQPTPALGDVEALRQRRRDLERQIERLANN
jgi:hypothetical protein